MMMMETKSLNVTWKQLCGDGKNPTVWDGKWLICGTEVGMVSGGGYVYVCGGYVQVGLIILGLYHSVNCYLFQHLKWKKTLSLDRNHCLIDFDGLKFLICIYPFFLNNVYKWKHCLNSACHKKTLFTVEQEQSGPLTLTLTLITSTLRKLWQIHCCLSLCSLSLSNHRWLLCGCKQHMDIPPCSMAHSLCTSFDHLLITTYSIFTG